MTFDPRVLLSAEGLAALVSLAVMEIVLGIDNIIFVAILSQKVAPASRHRVRRLGISLALVMRIGLLLTLSWIMGLTRPLLHVAGVALSGRDFVLLAGGLFLMAKSTHELYGRLELGGGEGDQEGDEEGDDDAKTGGRPHGSYAGFASTLVQILLLDIVFSLDSVITAVGMAQAVIIMIAAMIVAVIVMLVFADAISEFIGRHPSMKILALAFLLLIGFLLVADAFGHHINKGYVYFAMAFALGIEVFNMRVRKKARAHAKGNP
ncbi:MAG: Integral rane protein TerC [Myxococcales bacterium]|nr:Integral rane protein TerC [Myxococcales bacterium]